MTVGPLKSSPAPQHLASKQDVQGSSAAPRSDARDDTFHPQGPRKATDELHYTYKNKVQAKPDPTVNEQTQRLHPLELQQRRTPGKSISKSEAKQLEEINQSNTSKRRNFAITQTTNEQELERPRHRSDSGDEEKSRWRRILEYILPWIEHKWELGEKVLEAKARQELAQADILEERAKQEILKTHDMALRLKQQEYKEEVFEVVLGDEATSEEVLVGNLEVLKEKISLRPLKHGTRLKVRQLPGNEEIHLIFHATDSGGELWTEIQAIGDDATGSDTESS